MSNKYFTFRVKDKGILQRHWHNEIEPAIMAAMPPTAYPDIDVSTNILKAILDEQMQLWVIARRLDGKLQIVAIGTTAFIYDGPSGLKNLSIYTLYGFNQIPPHALKDGLDKIREFAREHGCGRIFAFTERDRVREMFWSKIAGEGVSQLSVMVVEV